ncbi:MAG: hypothetical protein R3D59_18945 [Paracoccaceae bacterium]
MTSAQVSIGTGFCATSCQEVIIAVMKSISRSSRSGNAITVRV